MRKELKLTQPSSQETRFANSNPIKVIQPFNEAPPIEKDKRNLADVDLFSLFTTDSRKKADIVTP